MDSPFHSAHVIVFGDPKHGSGKTALAMHLVIALLKAGRKVASIDADAGQLSLTRYLENRARWARRASIELELPTHFSVSRGAGSVANEPNAEEQDAFVEIVARLGEVVDFVVIDTPADDSSWMRLAHAMADTLVTPISDRFADLDVLAELDAGDFAVKQTSSYAELVRTARASRHMADDGEMDWVVVRNRRAALGSRNQAALLMGLRQLSDVLEFRVVDGVSDRVVFHELFPLGLTAFDRFDRETLGMQPTLSHVAARREASDLVAALKLPGLTQPVDQERPLPVSAA